MQLIAMCRLKVDGKYVLTNEKFEIKDSHVAEDLIRRGRAKDASNLPVGTKVVVDKSGPSVKKAEGKPGGAATKADS
ncbi:hypothetical protein [Paraburkholderia youngii]|uniref:hypothetical protein n=1 Tax=Paraburkholderia youngii TaxID=2782701 RepID=UPI00159146B5|nr:hypothetical protein [Paraburkholderia youngii]NUX55927.1 hypothetical protein [Paraburkholderia youngii]